MGVFREMKNKRCNRFAVGSVEDVSRRTQKRDDPKVKVTEDAKRPGLSTVSAVSDALLQVHKTFIKFFEQSLKLENFIRFLRGKIFNMCFKTKLQVSNKNWKPRQNRARLATFALY